MNSILFFFKSTMNFTHYNFMILWYLKITQFSIFVNSFKTSPRGEDKVILLQLKIQENISAKWGPPLVNLECRVKTLQWTTTGPNITQKSNPSYFHLETEVLFTPRQNVRSSCEKMAFDPRANHTNLSDNPSKSNYLASTMAITIVQVVP